MSIKDPIKRKEYNRKYYLENKSRFDEHNHQYYRENAEKERLRLQKYRREHPEKIKEYQENNKEKIRAYERIRYERIKDRKKIYDSIRHKEFYKAHPEIVKERKRIYSSKHMDKILQRNKNYLHRKRASGNGINISLSEWKTLCEKYGNRCLCCGKTNVKLTVDHIMPLSLGGRHCIENLQPLCRSCNSKKHTQYIDYRPDYQ